MHGIEHFFTDLVTGVVNAWRARAEVARSFFPTAAQKRRRLFQATLYAVALTILCAALGGSVIALLWWAFTIHERLPN